MKTIISLVVVSVVLFACVAKGSSVIYSTKDYELKAQLCRPEGNGPFPAVMYNHGGLGTTIGGAPSETCTALAKEGYVGFSPIRRPTRQLSGHLDDVMAAVDYLKGLPYVDDGRIGIMGFSRGGMLTFQAAARSNDFKAVVIMATAMGPGGRGLDLSEAELISAPLLLLVAENDTGSFRTRDMNTLEGTKRLTRALEAADKDVRLVIYPPYGSDGHTLFFNVGNYWPDIIEFLKKHL
jgi:dienelactone hydrolase